MATAQLKQTEVDLYRGTLLRYLGYANELGESFRAFIGSRMVKATYVVALGYGLADAVDKSRKQLAISQQHGDSIRKQRFECANGFVQTLYWQSLASVFIPGMIINRVVATSGWAMNRLSQNPVARKWVPTAVGLAIIPVIIHPIDTFVDKSMQYIPEPAARWVEETVLKEQ